MKFRATITIQGPCFVRYNPFNGYQETVEESEGVRLPLREWGKVLKGLPFVEMGEMALLATGPIPKGSQAWRKL